MKKGRLLCLVLALLLCIGMVPLASLQAAADESGDFGYELINNGNAVEITDYYGSGGALAIPATIAGKPVTSINGWTFYGRDDLTSVTFPNSVTKIGSCAFESCENLTSVTFGSGLKTIDFSDFAYSPKLATFYVSSANPNYTSVNGVVFNKAKTTLVCYPQGNAAKSYAIPAGVTDIGRAAFADCRNLTSIAIPSSVTGIGNFALGYCTGLTSITIPNGVVSIGDEAFYSCSNLTSITIPNSVTQLGDYVFEDCVKLTSITFGSGLKTIDLDAFYGCPKLASVHVNSANPNYTSVNGVLFNKAKTALVRYPCGNTAKTYAIPAGVTGIDRSAFADCSNLTSVTIPSSVTKMGYYAFGGCAKLSSVTLGSGLKTINLDAFYGCPKLASIHVNSANPNYSSVNGVLFNKAKTTLIRYPQGNAAKSYVIPSGVTAIGDDAFSECSNLTSVTIPSGVTKIGSYAFTDSDKLASVTIPSGVTAIGKEAFYGCNSLAAIAIPATVTSVGKHAFSGTKWYSSRPNGLLYVGKVAYTYKGDMPANTAIAIKDGTVRIADFAFFFCEGLKSITIPNSVTNIGEQAFWHCPSLKSITIPNSVKSIGPGVFDGCAGIAAVTVGSANANYCSVDGVLYNKAKTQLIYYPAAKTNASYTAPAGVKKINNDAFGYGEGRKFTSVSIPNTVTQLAYGTFAGCSKLQNITLPSSLPSISRRLFEGCTQLKSVTIPKNVASIEMSAFARCEQLSSITIPNSVITIATEAFYRCSQLESVTIPNGVKTIGDWAFYRCSQLKSVSIPNSVKTIEEGAFGYCSLLSSVVLPNQLKTLENDTFYNCTNLKSVTIPASVTKISRWSDDGEYYTDPFNGCDNLTIKCFPNTHAYNYVTKYKLKHTLLTPVAVSGITLNSKTASVGIGQPYQLSATLAPANATYRDIKWTSANPNIAAVDANGKITPKAAGTVKITASAVGGKTATCTVTVKPGPSSVTLNYKTATIGVGEKTLNLNYTLSSGSASYKTVFSSSNTAVATVDQNGIVTGKKAGTANITVTTFNGRTAKCVVTVKPAPTSVTLNYKTKTLSKGGKVDLNSSLNAGAASYLRKFASSNTKIATVDSNGIVTAKAVGKATITVTTFNRRSASCAITVK